MDSHLDKIRPTVYPYFQTWLLEKRMGLCSCHSYQYFASVNGAFVSLVKERVLQAASLQHDIEPMRAAQRFAKIL